MVIIACSIMVFELLKLTSITTTIDDRTFTGMFTGNLRKNMLGYRQTIVKSTKKNIIGHRRSTQVNWLIYNCLVIVIVTVELRNETRSPGGMHDTRNGKFKITE